MRVLAPVVLIVTLAAAPLMAQQPPAQGRPGGPGGQGGRGGAPAAPAPMLDNATAKKAMAAAEAAAAAAMANVTIAIVDANGDLAMLNRLEGARGVAVTSAEGKARAAILFGMPTSQTPVRGGVPIVNDCRVIGAVGVGGAAPATDEQIAQAGVDAVK